MASQAQLLRCAVVQCRVVRLVGLVTVVAAQVFLLVRAARPEQLRVIFVAGLAAGVACFHCGGPPGPETDIGRSFFAPAIVRLTGTVAGRADGGAATL